MVGQRGQFHILRHKESAVVAVLFLFLLLLMRRLAANQGARLTAE